MPGEKILIVDDEPNIVELVDFHLKKEGYTVVSALTGKTALAMASNENPDLIILDLMLPEIDGLEVCKMLRKEMKTKNIPIIMLTAKSEEVDRVLGLEMGADDYVTKPFSPRELVARVKAVLRRITQTEQDDIIKCGDLVLDAFQHELTIRGKAVDLTPKEFELLRLLMQNRGRVFTREFLLEQVWGYEFYGDTRTVDVHIRRLRQKIEQDPSNPVLLETVHGVGYRFKEIS
ncbi:MAG: winged helix-turn-helix domain-containing protein [Bacillota bacterium]